MPYISTERRPELLPLLGEHGLGPKTPGELNFLITMLILGYQGYKTLSYQTINDILGALEGAKSEYYRRVAGPYENTKIATNGDVY